MSAPPKRNTTQDEGEPPSIEGLIAYVRALYQSSFPGQRPLRVIVDAQAGDEAEQLRLPIPQVSASGPCRHSLDYSDCVWFGEKLYFSKTQAAVVKVLWTAWEAGCPEVGQAALLEEAGSTGSRVRDIFKTHDAWGNSILLTERGTVCLRQPPLG